MDLPAEVLLAAVFHKGPDAVRLMAAGQEQVAADIRNQDQYAGAQHQERLCLWSPALVLAAPAA